MTDKSLFTDYLKELHAVAQQGDAREESFYRALADMLERVAKKIGRKDVRVTTLPKPTDAGNPDFRLWNGTDRIVGYVEAKKPTEERLDAIEDSEQLTRYRATFPNLILTNFFEFRLYENGKRIQTVLAARPFVMTRLCTTPVIEKADDLQALREFYRVLKTDGQAVILTPITSPQTISDPSLTDPLERERLFGQHDHVRRYGWDFIQRVEQAGFRVKVISRVELANDDEAARFGLELEDTIFLCEKSGPHSDPLE